MNKVIFTAAFTFLATFCVIAGPPGSGNIGQSVSFTENKGQVSDQYGQPRPDVLYSGLANGMVYHLKSGGISYQLNRVDSWREMEGPKFREKSTMPDKATIYRVDINWLNANRDVQAVGNMPLPGFSNYYLAVCPEGALEAKSYEEVLYRNIYKNIDLRYYSNAGSLKYDFIVAPGGDYKHIQLEIKGAESIVKNADGSISLKTPLGLIEEGAPMVFQQGRKLAARWTIHENILGFEVDGVNAALPLLIDPLTRAWGTWYGGELDDLGGGVALDGAGNSYLTGATLSSALLSIATVGISQTTLAAGRDAFLVKFDNNGIRQWGTYCGSNSNDGGAACAVNAVGHVYMVGTSNSTTGGPIATPGSHQTSLGGGSHYWSDAMLVKFSSNGLRMWGTFYGGISDDAGRGIALDAQDNVYIVGSANSNTTMVISTPGSHQQYYGGGNSNGGDGFIAKFNSAGVRQWGTYYGGANHDYISNCTADAAGNVYIVGSTSSYNAIASSGAHQTAFGAGSSLYNYDAFAAKFNTNGQRQWGTYYGGTGYDIGYGCTVDSNGNLYISGMSSSSVSGVMATAGSHEPNYISSAGYAAFLAKFNPGGVRQWATFNSAGYTTEGMCCAVNKLDEVYLAGVVSAISGAGLATPGSRQPAYGGGSSDGFITHFSAAGARLEGNYYGGTGSESIGSCATNTLGYLYISGSSSASPGPYVASAGSHQPNNAGGSDAFLAKFIECDTVLAAPAINVTPPGIKLCTGNAATLIANANGFIDWYETATDYLSLGSGSVYVTPVLASGYHTVYAEAKACTIGMRTEVTLHIDACVGLPSDPLNISSELNVYPNPNSGEFTLETPNAGNFSIYNTLGQLILSKQLSAGKNFIQLNGQTKGIYFITLEENNHSSTFKLIVE